VVTSGIVNSAILKMLSFSPKGVVDEERPLKFFLTKNPHPGIQLESKISIWLEFCFKGLPKK